MDAERLQMARRTETGDAEYEQARSCLNAAIEAAETGDGAASRFREARQILIGWGKQALVDWAGEDPALPELIRRAAAAPPNPGRRRFALLLIQALGIPGLLPRTYQRATLDADICGLVETSVPSVLVRARYPFGGSGRDRLGFLQGLHRTLDQHLEPFEPTFPPWLNALDQGRR